MGAIGRRRLLESAGVLLAAGRISAGNVVSPTIEGDNAGEPLLLRNFEPRSMLHVPETKVLRSRYPVIDIHTHLSSVAKHAGGVGIGEEMQYFATAEDVLPLMDRKNLRIMVNLTDGVGKGLQEAIRKFQTPHPDRFLTFTEPWWERTTQPGYSQFQDAENLPYVAECMDRFPNMHVEMAARIGELGRQPRMARKFFEKYQDRILFGTDAVPHGTDTPQQIFTDKLYEIYYRFLETEDEYFDYAPAPVPPQGRWRIYGLGLPDEILKKVYYENAARLLQIKI